MGGKKEGGTEKGGEGGGRENGLKAAWLAHLGECQSSEQEVVGSISSRTNTLGLKITERKVLPW